MDWYTRHQAIDYLTNNERTPTGRRRLSPRYLRTQVAQGKLRGARIGGRGELLFRREWLDEWVETKTKPAVIGHTMNRTTVYEQTRPQQASSPDPRVYTYAWAQAGHDNPGLWARILIWPQANRNSPDYWRHFCEHWSEHMGIQRNTHLNPVTAAAVLHTMVLGMSPDARGDLVCFHGYDAIARRAHVDRKTVQRVVHWQRDASAPLIQISRAEQTKGVRHPTFRLTLIGDPIAFATARDQARAANLEAFVPRYDFPERTQLQTAVILATPDQEQQAKRNLANGAKSALKRSKGRLPLRAVKALVTEGGTLIPQQARGTSGPTKTRYLADAGNQGQKPR